MPQDLSPFKILNLLQLLANPTSKQSRAESQRLLKEIEGYNNPELLYTLKLCLHSYNIPFEGNKEITLPSPPFHDRLSPDKFGKYFNHDLYLKAYFLCAFAKMIEGTGVPEEAASKLCVIFDDSKKMLEYLQLYTKSAQHSASPLHDACLFTLPDFQQEGFQDKENGCHFDIWKAIANQSENMMKKEFKELLPFVFEIEKIVKSNLQKDKKPDEVAINRKREEIKKLEKELSDLEKQKSDLTDEQDDRYEALPKEISDAKIALAELSKGKFLRKMSVDEIKAFYELYQISTQGAYSIFIKNGIPKSFFYEFESLTIQDDDEKIPNVQIDGATIGYPGFYFMKVPVLTKEHAARAACLGKATNCCQSLSGEAGHSCAVHGLTSPYGGFYVVCKGDMSNPKINDEIMGQCWVWRSRSNALVYDSVEVSLSAHITHATPMIKAFYEYVGRKLVKEGKAPKVACGAKSGISWDTGVISPLNEIETFVDYDGYCDSQEQRVIYDKNLPFLFYETDAEAAQETEKMIIEALQSKAPFAQSHFLNALLNWAILEQNRDMLEKIRAHAKGLGQLENIDQMISTLQRFIAGDMEIDEILTLLTKNQLYYRVLDTKGNSPLKLAKNKHLLEVAMALLDSTLINVKTDDGNTPLIVAIDRGLIETPLQLIQLGAEINVQGVDGKTPLHHAIISGHRELSLKLIEKGADIHAVTRSGETPLMLAAHRGDLKLVSALIRQGASLEAKDEQGRTALMHAADTGETNIIIALIKQGADVNALDNNNATALHYLAKSFVESTEAAVALIDAGANVNAQDVNFDTPLLAATKYSIKPFTYALVNAGADPNARNKAGRTPLMLAQNIYGCQDFISFLLAKGAQVDARDNEGKTALMLVENLENANLLIQAGADVNAEDEKGQTALICALNQKIIQEDVILFLIKNGAKIDVKDSEGNTPLILATKKRLGVTSTLIAMGGADIKDKSSTAPLLLAIKHGLEKEAIAIIEQGADLTLRDENEDTYLMLALQHHLDKLANVLLERGADIHAVDEYGRTPLILAIENCSEIALSLIHQGADINAKTKGNLTALLIAVKKGFTALASALIEAGADVNAEDRMLQFVDTPLLLAVENRLSEIASSLIKYGAQLNTQNHEGNTPLHIAIKNRMPEVALDLIANGADLTLKNRFAQTPFYLAIVNNQPQLALAMIERGVSLNAEEGNRNQPLIAALEEGQDDVALEMIKRGANIHITDFHGGTPLLIALKAGLLDVAYALIERGADPTIADRYGDSALTRMAYYLADPIWSATYKKYTQPESAQSAELMEVEPKAQPEVEAEQENTPQEEPAEPKSRFETFVGFRQVENPQSEAEPKPEVPAENVSTETSKKIR